ncbi:MAG: hypothetical protein ACK452_00805 [Bacteroidota bacterium]|jgi:hypothetical protein
MKYLIIVLAILSLNLTAQSISSSEGRIQGILKQKIEYNKFNEGEYDGFRVKIHSSGDLGEAQKIKSIFLDLFTDIPVYERYVQPNFTILVGDFRTKLEAYAFMKIAQSDFPSAFIVKDKIKPINLEEEAVTKAD